MSDAPTAQRPARGIGKRILWITFGLMFAQFVGSVFNIWYNLTHIRPLLADVQIEKFTTAIAWFNCTVYPAGAVVWILIVLSIARACKSGDRSSAVWEKGVRRMINLPWIGVAFTALGWFLSIPVLLMAVNSTAEALDPQVNLHLPVSIVIAALISMAQGFFAVEILTQRLLYPLFLTDANSAALPGTFQITLKRRGVIWVVASVVCPVLSLLLLFIVAAPGGEGSREIWFPVSVGAVGIAFGFVSVYLLARIVIEPVEALRRAARQVGEGDLDTQIDLLRTDEFGTLIDQFNRMVGGLREKRHVENVLGRNVGLKVARHLLEQEDALKGTERVISVMFVDIRGFTPRSARSTPPEIVTMLNIFFDGMVPEVASRNGIVNTFVGDGFLAIFGAIEDDSEAHEENATAAGRAMLEVLLKVNEKLAEVELDPIAIGVGVNSGPAVVGSVGTTGRAAFTAIGDTVNVTARIESLTKEAGYPMLISNSTYEALSDKEGIHSVPPMMAKGKSKPVTVWGINE